MNHSTATDIPCVGVSSNGSIGFLIVGHGTRNLAGQEQFRNLFVQMTGDYGPYCLPTHISALAFLELAEPDIPTAIAQLHQRGVRDLVVVPALLFAAGHAQNDIPQAVRGECKRLGMRVLSQTSSLGSDPNIVALSAQRFHEAFHGLEQADGSQVGLAFIGRGSNSDPATAAMLDFAAARTKITPVAWSTTGFIHAQCPSVNEALDHLENTGLPYLVVQPHLIFEGELINNLRREVAYRQSTSNLQRWIITEPLGADIQLAKTLCRLAFGAATNI